MNEFELSFRNPEVRMFTLFMLPAVLISLLIILFSHSDSKLIYASASQTLGLLSFYIWRFIYRTKENTSK